MKLEFILVQDGTKFRVSKKPMAGALSRTDGAWIEFSIAGPVEPTLPTDPQTINELLVWAARLVERGFNVDF